MPVDISQTKSCWYGESEKRIKEVFDTYRCAVENSKNAPILLFNEADAIIGKRQINNDNNHSTDKTDNRIQNIILQEIENLSGILIATTNLTQNMDSAFERRFLYKITFGKPNHESRANIWKSLLPGLPEDWAAALAKDFDLSGGQIENIARKTEVETILSGKERSLDALARYSQDELKSGFYATTKIGFGNG
jgi:SpoVK/Ycf46/Vps4 family AAA+-type ATPase